jgi:hypothetical protein
VTVDADGQHEPAYVAQLTAPICAGQADVVIGSYPSRASLLRATAWRYFHWLTDLGLEDLTSGFRAYNRAAIERLARADASLLDYQDVGSLMLLRQSGLTALEVPVKMVPRVAGRSRVFHSWAAVTQYMLHTSIICLALSSRPGRRRYRRRTGI